jgi:hypothetical protein
VGVRGACLAPRAIGRRWAGQDGVEQEMAAVVEEEEEGPEGPRALEPSDPGSAPDPSWKSVRER